MNPLLLLNRYIPSSFDDDQRRRASLLMQLTVVFLVLAPVVGVATIVSFEQPGIGLLVVAMVVPLGSLPLVLRRTRSLALSVSLLNLTVICSLVASSVATGGVAQPSTAWMALLPLLAVAVAGTRTGLRWAAVGTVVPSMLLLLERLGALTPHPQRGELLARGSLVNWVALVLAAVALGILSEELRLKTMGELRAAHRELTAAREQQILTDRLTAIGTLAAGVAHELNNPLATIASSARYLIEEAKEQSWGADAQSAASDVVEAAVRATDIIRDLRDFTRPATDERPVAQLEPAWASAVRLLRPGLRHRAALRCEVPAPLPAVKLPPSRLVQVLLNLLTNSMQAMPAGEGAQVTLGARHEGAFVEFTLADTGSGMSEETARRAFDPFFTTRTVGEGVGLGLFVAQSIVTGAGGSIALRSARGSGTTVTCRLPIAA